MRQKEFSPEAVLEKCITLFWNKGFGACAISDIVEATNVNRFSLYDTFGSKEGILLASLELYLQRYGRPKLEHLNKQNLQTEDLYRFYESYLTEFRGRPAGCYIVHTATELADANSDVRQILDSYIQEIETGLSRLFPDEEYSQEEQIFLIRQLVGLFCTSISFCLIHNHQERIRLIQNGVQVILKQKGNHAQID